jgi:site-specific DNA-methyltransferase (adenine-specific)
MNEEYFRKRKSPPEEMKTESKISKKDWIPWASNVWEISPIIKFNHKGKNLRKHIAPFPEEIPYRLVKLSSFQQDIVFQRGTGIRSQHSRS